MSLIPSAPFTKGYSESRGYGVTQSRSEVRSGDIFDIRISLRDEEDLMFSTKGYATHGAHEPLKPFSFERRDPTPGDVQIEILFCGVCHSDLHIARNEWGSTTYPCGLGHMAVKFAKAFGAEVVLFTTSPGKAGDAKRFGAHEVVLSRDEEAMKRQLNSFDFILDTASGKHDLNAYLELLKHDGMLTLVGIPAEPEAISVMPLVRRRRGLTGSLIGGIAETQEMLDFCADRGITCEIEMIPMEQINEAYERMLKSDVKYRFVIDVARLR